MVDFDKDVDERRQELIEQEPLVRLFDSPTVAKILVVLIDAAHDMTATQIAEQAGVSRNAWYDNKDILLELDLVEETDEKAGAQCYRAKMDSEQMGAVTTLYDALRL